ncbi:MAG: indolepyruvate oxidoreductase subunit beta family protein, partial [Gammaproteobacteria bacterium]|nr:indolepyruvate oxidoreductase subunit beta family protein [Gammaproteobacteria bacterium]
GGGVLSDWILQVAEAAGWTVQTTSVPGVAQRTGATVYNLALCPPGEGGRRPVLGLVPVPGDVDICIAAELMEAGRAVQRGLVTPDRTVLIASTHRDYAIEEKSALGDGRKDSDLVLDVAARAARQLVAFDMEALAREHGSVISAVLLGVLAGSGALPFERDAYEAAIRHAGKGVDASLAAFAAGHARARGEGGVATRAVRSAEEVELPRGLREQVAVGYAEPLRSVVTLGVARLLDYQDEAYAALYLQRLEPFVGYDAADAPLAREVARHLAVWMAFEDTFRVADLKRRPERMARIRDEVGAAPGEVLRVTEYLHPRLEELSDSLPEPWGRRVLEWPWLRALAGRFVGRGRCIATHTVAGYLQLSLLARGRRWRRDTPRYVREQAAIEAWLARLAEVAPADPALAVELARCQALVRGYGETHARGEGAYERILHHAQGLVGQPGAAETVARLREAALADEQGAQLGEVLVTLERRPKPSAA